MWFRSAYFKIKAIEEVSRLVKEKANEVDQAIVMFDHTSSHMHQRNYLVFASRARGPRKVTKDPGDAANMIPPGAKKRRLMGA